MFHVRILHTASHTAVVSIRCFPPKAKRLATQCVKRRDLAHSPPRARRIRLYQAIERAWSECYGHPCTFESTNKLLLARVCDPRPEPSPANFYELKDEMPALAPPRSSPWILDGAADAEHTDAWAVNRGTRNPLSTPAVHYRTPEHSVFCAPLTRPEHTST